MILYERYVHSEKTSESDDISLAPKCYLAWNIDYNGRLICQILTPQNRCLCSFIQFITLNVCHFLVFMQRLNQIPISTHLPLVPHTCGSKSGQHSLRLWLGTYSAPSNYLNQCWVIVNWILGNKLQWNFNQNRKCSISYENIGCEIAAILSTERRVK